MLQLQAKVNMGINLEWKKVAKSEIELGLPFTVPYIEYKFQMICLRGT